MLSGGTTTLSVVFHRFPVRVIICLLIGVSTFFGFLAFYKFHDYEPLHIQFSKALIRTLEVHSGLWLATLEIKSRWRFMVAALMIPSGIGVYLLLWNYNLWTIVAAGAGLGWLLYKVLRGERFDD